MDQSRRKQLEAIADKYMGARKEMGDETSFQSGGVTEDDIRSGKMSDAVGEPGPSGPGGVSMDDIRGKRKAEEWEGGGGFKYRMLDADTIEVVHPDGRTVMVEREGQNSKFFEPILQQKEGVSPSEGVGEEEMTQPEGNADDASADTSVQSPY